MLKKRINIRCETRVLKVRSGFSILEVVATIALIILLSTLIIGGLSKIDSFTNGNKTIERGLIAAVKSASNIAQSQKKYTELTYDRRGFYEIADLETSVVDKRIFLKAEDEKKFEDAKKQNKDFIVDNLADMDEVVFVLEKPIVYGKERAVFPLEDRQSIIFAPDGSSCKFSAIIKSKAFEKNLELKFDNFSAMPYANK
ncbi:MAG: hypothetical protein J6B07_04920 [Opitutales bacterium]|nr:hypothetical protein [Opitutales bacterium]